MSLIMPRTGALAAAMIGCSIIGVAGTARAEGLTKEQCVAANEDAQSLRQTHKLRDARAQLVTCIDRSCPRPVREDCEAQLRDVDLAMPTVVFVVKDPAGREIPAVEVTVDGLRIAERWSGAPLAVDPGEHVVSIGAEGYSSVVRLLTLQERTKAHREVITLAATGRGSTTPVAPVSSPAPLHVETPEPSGSGVLGPDQATIAYVAGGVGVGSLLLGTYFAFRAKAAYDDATTFNNCPRGLSTCNRAGADGVDTAHTEAVISAIGFIAGGVLLAASIGLLITAPKPRAARVQPVLGTSTAGLQVRGSF